MNQEKLHKVQQLLLDLLRKNTEHLLTIREMQTALGLSSPSVAAHHLAILEKKGYLKRNPYNPRDYQVAQEDPEKKIAWLNLYGLAQCGKEGRFLDNPIDCIPIATRLLSFPSFEGFLVKAIGDSMQPRIREGDYVIGQRLDHIENGMIAICVNNGQALIKKVQKDGNSIILFSLNSDYLPFLAASDFRVIGQVKGVISREG